jgi:hypothetical protein
MTAQAKDFHTPRNAPRCAAIENDGQLLVGDTSTREVYRFTPNGTPQPLTAKAYPGGIGIPMSIAPAAPTMIVRASETRMMRKPPYAGKSNLPARRR